LSNGLRQTMSGVWGTTTCSYDSRNRLTSKQAPLGTLSYTYDNAGNLLTLTTSNTNGASLTYTYDTLNRLSTVTDDRLLAQGAASGMTTYNYDGRVARPFRIVFLPRFETAGAPSLRFLQGRVRCCRTKVFSMGRNFVSESSGVSLRHKIRGSQQSGTRPSQNARRTGHPLCGYVTEFKNSGHPPKRWGTRQIDCWG
jgi:YD repeat-containing protein